MTPQKRQLARTRAQVARHALSQEITACNASELQKAAMHDALRDLWANAQDAWAFDEGGPVYPCLQTQVRREKP
jgi:hypothetical protein